MRMSQIDIRRAALHINILIPLPLLGDGKSISSCTSCLFHRVFPLACRLETAIASGLAEGKRIYGMLGFISCERKKDKLRPLQKVEK